MQDLLPVVVGLAAGMLVFIVALVIMIDDNDAYSIKHAREDFFYLSRFHNNPLETISLDEGSSGRNYETDVKLMHAEEAMKSCKPAYIIIGYGLGGMQVAIEGVANGSCTMAITYDIEMGAKSLDCSVPPGKMAKWESWKNADVPSISEISEYCKEIRVHDGMMQQQ
ncbi:MAG: hypothetical protein ABI347_02045 [Nitrososphaera sp.]|jgi:hypothetical protein